MQEDQRDEDGEEAHGSEVDGERNDRRWIAVFRVEHVSRDVNVREREGGEQAASDVPFGVVDASALWHIADGVLLRPDPQLSHPRDRSSQNNPPPIAAIAPRATG